MLPSPAFAFRSLAVRMMSSLEGRFPVSVTGVILDGGRIVLLRNGRGE
ncbi:hypothetical protein BH24ACT18_BH24ACT18_12580 [soil metagenome]